MDPFGINSEGVGGNGQRKALLGSDVHLMPVAQVCIEAKRGQIPCSWVILTTEKQVVWCYQEGGSCLPKTLFGVGKKMGPNQQPNRRIRRVAGYTRLSAWVKLGGKRQINWRPVKSRRGHSFYWPQLQVGEWDHCHWISTRNSSDKYSSSTIPGPKMRCGYIFTFLALLFLIFFLASLPSVQEKRLPCLSLPVTTHPIIFATLRHRSPLERIKPPPRLDRTRVLRGTNCAIRAPPRPSHSWLINASSSNPLFIGSPFLIGLNRIQTSPIRSSFHIMTHGSWENLIALRDKIFWPIVSESFIILIERSIISQADLFPLRTNLISLKSVDIDEKFKSEKFKTEKFKNEKFNNEKSKTYHV